MSWYLVDIVCANLITPHSLPHARLNKGKPIYHSLPASLDRDPAGNTDGINGDCGREYLSASETEGSSSGSEDGDF